MTPRRSWSAARVSASPPIRSRASRASAASDQRPCSPASTARSSRASACSGSASSALPRAVSARPSIADSVQPALGGLEVLVRSARAVAGGEPGLSTPLVERGQLGGASLPGEERLHGLGGFDLEGIEVQHPLEGVDGALGLLELVHPQTSGLEPGLDGPLAAPGGGGLRLPREGGGLGLPHPEPDPADALEGDELGGLEREGGLVGGERQGKGLRCALSELAQAEVQLEPGRRSLGDAEAALVEVAEAVEVTGVPEHALELEGDAGIFGVDEEGAPEVLQPLVETGADVLQLGREPQRGRESRIRDARGEALPHVRAPGTVRGPGVLEEQEGAHVVRLQLERRLGDRRGAVEVTGGEQGMGETEPCREALGRLAGHGGALESLERVGSTIRPGERLQLAEGRDVVRREAEDRLQGRCGGGAVGERIQLEGGDLEEGVRTSARVGPGPGGALQRRHEAGPVALPALDAGQRAERGPVVRVPAKHLVPGSARGIQVEETGLLEIGDPRPELDGAGGPCELGLAPVHPPELLPATLAGVEPSHRLERGEVGAVRVQEPLQDGDGGDVVVQPLLQHLRRAVPERDGLRGVGGAFRLPLEERDQLVPRLAPLGQPRQVHQGGEVVGGEVQRPAEGVGGEVEVAEVLLRLLGDAAQRDHAVRGGGDGE